MRKAVIPAAGFGTRMLPAAKAVPKEMLPVLDRPVIQYVVAEAADAGADDVLLVTSRGKRAVEDHFDRNEELEEHLRRAGRDSLLKSITELAARVNIHAVRQRRQLGLGDAVLHARQHVGQEPFLCLLGDTIFSGEPSPSRQLVQAYEQVRTSVVALEEVPPEKVSRYGIVDGREIKPGLWRLQTLVEKPSPQVAPSRLAIAARYVLTPAIFACLEKTARGNGGEVQLTDAMRMLLAQEPIHGVVVRAHRQDVGNPADWLRANLLMARTDRELWKQISPLVEDLLRDGMHK